MVDWLLRGVWLTTSIGSSITKSLMNTYSVTGSKLADRQAKMELMRVCRFRIVSFLYRRFTI